jgi:hypothetical protein
MQRGVQRKSPVHQLDNGGAKIEKRDMPRFSVGLKMVGIEDAHPCIVPT